MEKCKVYLLVLLFYSISIFSISNCSNTTFTSLNVTNVVNSTEISLITRVESTNSTANQTLVVRESSEEDFEGESGGGSSGAEESNPPAAEESNPPAVEESIPPVAEPLNAVEPEELLPQPDPQQQQIQSQLQQQTFYPSQRPLPPPGPTTTEESALALFSHKLVPAFNGYISTFNAVRDAQAWAETVKDRITNPKSILPNVTWRDFNLLSKLQSETVTKDPAHLAPFNSQYLLAPLKQTQLLTPFRPDKLLTPFKKPQASAITEEPLEQNLEPESFSTARSNDSEILALLKVISGHNLTSAEPVPIRKPDPIFPPLKPAHSEPIPGLSSSKLNPVSERPTPPKPSQALPPSLLAPLFIPSQILQQLSPSQILETFNPEQLLAPFKPAPTPAPTEPPPTPSTRRTLIYSRTSPKTVTSRPTPQAQAIPAAPFFNYPSLIDIFGPFTLPPRPSGIEIVTLGTPIRRKNHLRPLIDDEAEEESITLDPEQIPGFLHRYQDNFGTGGGTKARERELTTTQRPKTTTKPWISNFLFFLE